MEALNSFMTEASVMKELKDTLWLIRSVFTEYRKQICSTFLHATFTMLRKRCRYSKDSAGNCMFKAKNENARTKVWNMFKVNNRSGVFIVNFDYISHLALVSLLLTLTMQTATEELCKKLWTWLGRRYKLQLHTVGQQLWQPGI